MIIENIPSEIVMVTRFKRRKKFYHLQAHYQSPCRDSTLSDVKV